MKAHLLANFVIVCVAVSAMVSVLSHMGLTWTDKVIPLDIYTLWSSLAVGTVAAGLLARNLDQSLSIPKTYLNYVLMGLATTQVVFTINYHLLVWSDRPTQAELVPAIIGLSTTVLTLTNFRNSNAKKSASLSQIAEEIDTKIVELD